MEPMQAKEPMTLQTKSSAPLKLFSQKILILLVFIGVAYTLSLLTSVLAILFFSGFLTILFSPFLTSMNKRGIPDWLGIIFIFLGILLFLFIVLFAIIPIFAKQITLLFTYIGSSFGNLESLYKSGGVDALGFPSFLKKYIQTVDLGNFFEFVRSHASSFSSVVTSVSKNLLESSTSILASLSGGIFQMILIGVFTFFMSLERHSVKEFLYQILPRNMREYIILREDSFLQVLGSWLKGQLILSLCLFILTLVGLFALRLFGVNIDNIFTLALIAGLMEFIPFIGPILALLPAFAIAAGVSGVAVISVLVLYILIQQAENNIFVPMVMSKTLDLSPLLILVMMTIMANLFGIAGVLLAIPFTAILQIVVKDFLMGRKGEDSTKNLTKKGKSI